MLKRLKKALYLVKPSNIKEFLIANLFRNSLVIYWSHSKGGTANVGDVLNEYLIHRISGKKPVNYKNLIFLKKEKEKYSVIGSVLNQFKSSDLIVWGSGFIQQPLSLKFTVKKIYAVRGPLTKKIFDSFGIDCPNIFGDPAVLLPNYYFPIIAKKYKYGIVPHYSDKNSEALIKFLKKNPSVKFIDVETEVEDFVLQLLQCENIISSSLHGIIISDAYKIPNVRVHIKGKLVGGDFKFEDYFLSINRTLRKTILLDENTDLTEIDPFIDLGDVTKIQEDLLSHSPFIK
jgi:pyruvyltransferase